MTALRNKSTCSRLELSICSARCVSSGRWSRVLEAQPEQGLCFSGAQKPIRLQRHLSRLSWFMRSIVGLVPSASCRGNPLFFDSFRRHSGPRLQGVAYLLVLLVGVLHGIGKHGSVVQLLARICPWAKTSTSWMTCTSQVPDAFIHDTGVALFRQFVSVI